MGEEAHPLTRQALGATLGTTLARQSGRYPSTTLCYPSGTTLVLPSRYPSATLVSSEKGRDQHLGRYPNSCYPCHFSGARSRYSRATLAVAIAFATLALPFPGQKWLWATTLVDFVLCQYYPSQLKWSGGVAKSLNFPTHSPTEVARDEHTSTAQGYDPSSRKRHGIDTTSIRKLPYLSRGSSRIQNVNVTLP